MEKRLFDIHEVCNMLKTTSRTLRFYEEKHIITYNCLIISAKQNSIICEEAGCTIEPLNPSGIQIAVVWKKASSNALVRSFSELLASNQAAINAEYEK